MAQVEWQGRQSFTLDAASENKKLPAEQAAGFEQTPFSNVYRTVETTPHKRHTGEAIPNYSLQLLDTLYFRYAPFPNFKFFIDPIKPGEAENLPKIIYLLD